MIPVIPFIIGGAVGAVGALLLSPRSGEENREIVAEKIEQYTGNGEQLFQRAADAVRDKADDVAETAGPAADDIRTKINEARDRIADQVSRNNGGAKEVAAEVSDATEQAESESSEPAKGAGAAADKK